MTAVDDGDGNDDEELPEEDTEDGDSEEGEELVEINDGLVTSTVFVPTATCPVNLCTLYFQRPGFANSSSNSSRCSRTSFRANCSCSCLGNHCPRPSMAEFGAYMGGRADSLCADSPHRVA